MALTFSAPTHKNAGSERATYGTITFDSSYPTGGEAYTNREMGLGTINSLQLEQDDGYIPYWDNTNSKIKLFWADYDAVADGALIEVADTTDVSSVIVKWRAWGY